MNGINLAELQSIFESIIEEFNSPALGKGGEGGMGENRDTNFRMKTPWLTKLLCTHKSFLL
jgi:hypothetical protein